MDGKNLDTKNGSCYSNSSEKKDEDTSSGNSSEPSLDKKCALEAPVAENFSINHENSNTTSDESAEKSYTASYAEMHKSNRKNAYEKSSLGSKKSNSTRSRAFTEYRNQSGYSADNSASESSTANVSEEEVSPPRTFERKSFSSELKNDTNIASCSYGKNTLNSCEDIQTSPSIQRLCKNMQNSDAVWRYFDGIERFDENITTSEQPIITQTATYKGKFASLPNTANPSSRFLYSYLEPCNVLKIKALIEDLDNDTLNPLEDLSSIESSLNNVSHGMQVPHSERLSFIASRSSNESDISDEPKNIFKNNDPVLMDIREIEQCPKLSPIEEESGKEKSLNDMSELIPCSELPNNDESTRRNDSSLKNRKGISPTLDISSMNKENHLNETEVGQCKTFKGSRSYFITEDRESKIMKPSSAAESPTGTLRNVDINSTKRPASPDDNLSPECHGMTKEVKKQKIE